MNTIIQTKMLCKSFSNGETQTHVIKNMDLEVEDGAFTVIMGSSGSGKSTLLYALSGMDKPTLGEVWFREQNIATLSHDALAVFRRENCGFIFQQIHLMDNMSVLDNVLTNGLLVSRDKKALAEKAQALLLRVGLDASLWNKFPSQLSGGEAQRVGIVRALINTPAILFADEPTGALNSASSQAVLDTISAVHAQGQSVVLVTHDLKTAIRGSRILYLRDGAVAGELMLSPYAEDNHQKRIETVQRFLDTMGW